VASDEAAASRDEDAHGSIVCDCRWRTPASTGVAFP
jgi:hypothetical protein